MARVRMRYVATIELRGDRAAMEEHDERQRAGENFDCMRICRMHAKMCNMLCN